jgi:hypothetical protein
VLDAGFAQYLRAFTDGPTAVVLTDREGARRQPFLRRSLLPAVRAAACSMPSLRYDPSYC